MSRTTAGHGPLPQRQFGKSAEAIADPIESGQRPAQPGQTWHPPRRAHRFPDPIPSHKLVPQGRCDMAADDGECPARNELMQSARSIDKKRASQALGPRDHQTRDDDSQHTKIKTDMCQARHPVLPDWRRCGQPGGTAIPAVHPKKARGKCSDDAKAEPGFHAHCRWIAQGVGDVSVLDIGVQQQNCGSPVQALRHQTMWS